MSGSKDDFASDLLGEEPVTDQGLVADGSGQLPDEPFEGVRTNAGLLSEEFDLDRVAPPAPPKPSGAHPPAPPEGYLEVGVALEEDAQGQMSLEDASPLKVMFGCAMCQSNGVARFANLEGTIKLCYLGGRVISAETTIDRLDSHEGESRDWLMALLADLITWEDGRCQFVEGIVPPPKGMRFIIDPYVLPVEVLRRMPLPEWLEEQVEPFAKAAMVPAAVGEVELSSLPFDEGEFKVTRSIDGTKTLDELLKDVEDDEKLTILRVAYLGRESELIVEGASGAELDKQKEQIAALEAEYAKLKKSNYFEILGISPDNTDLEVRNRYLEVRRALEQRFPGHPPPKIAEIQGKLAELYEKAYKTLASKERRERGRSVVSGVRSVVTGVSAPPTAAFDAGAAEPLSSVALFEAAEEAAHKGNGQEALQNIQRAIETRPDKSEYKMYEIYYKALFDRFDRRGTAAAGAAEISEMLETEASNVVGHLLLGRLYRFARDQDRAAWAFQRALDLDPENEEAQREVRMAGFRDGNEPIPSIAGGLSGFFKKLVGGEEEPPKKKKKKK